MRDGRAAGLAAVAGNEIGVYGWALAAGAGLTALLRANWWLYLAMHVVGAVVLVYLGVSAWRGARRDGDDGEFGAALAVRLPSGRTPAAAFRASLHHRGLTPRRRSSRSRSSRSSCPGTARCSARPRRWPPCRSSSTAAIASCVVLLASRARNWLSRVAVRRRLERVLGATLVALGIDLAAASR